MVLQLLAKPFCSPTLLISLRKYFPAKYFLGPHWIVWWCFALYHQNQANPAPDKELVIFGSLRGVKTTVALYTIVHDWITFYILLSYFDRKYHRA